MSKLKYLVVVIIAIMMCMLCSGVTVFAEERTEGVSIAHVTDLHYYPTHMSYSEKETDYTDSAFYTKSVTEMRLLTESSSNLRATLAAVELANPDYLVVTGDMSSDGERQGLIDVANALRALQNTIRDNGNANFQIAVVAGNHDISNPNATDYSTVEGTATDSVTREEFAMIFAGLGFEDMTAVEAERFYTHDELEYDSVVDKYLPYDVADGGSKFVESSKAKNVTIDRIAEIGDTLSAGDLSYIMRIDNGIATENITILGLDTVMTNGEVDADNYDIGGELTIRVQGWIDGNLTKDDKNIISLTHHNILEHFTLEEELMTDFVLNNYEMAREFLIGQGVKYNFSGHVHSNDIASFVNYDGETLYDITTSSNVGFSPSYRTTEVVFNTDGSSDMDTVSHKLGAVDYSQLFNDEFLIKSNYTQSHLWEISENGVVDSGYEYAYGKIFTDMDENIISQIVSKKGIDAFKSKIISIIDELPAFESGLESINDIIVTIKRVAPQIMDNFIDEVNGKVLSDYDYNGDNKEFMGEDNKIIAILYEMSLEIANIRVAKVRSEVYDMGDFMLFAYGEFSRGGEACNISETPEWFQQALENMYTGEILIELEEILKDEYYPFIKELFNVNLDLSNNITATDLADINKGLVLISSGQSIDNINLDKFVKDMCTLLGVGIEGTVVEELDNAVAQNMTKSASLKLSNYIIDIALSMAVDSSFDGHYGDLTNVLYKTEDKLSHGSEPRTDISPSVADGRLPSMLTVGFGEDPTSTKEIVWFTDSRIGGSTIQYMEGSLSTDFVASKSVVQKGSTAVYAYDYTLLDTPIFSTSRTKEIARHQVSLKDLKPDTSYVYRVGDSSAGYWSDVYVITTGAEGVYEPFEAFVMSDMNGSNASNYKNINTVINGAKSVFHDKDFDFIINLGESVDNANNMNQWRLALDTSTQIYANTSTVVLGGKSDDQTYEYSVTDGYYPSAGVIKEYETLNMHYNLPSVTTDANYYSFDYSGVHFTVLDTNDIANGVNGRLSFEQEEWLKKDLEQSISINKVVLMNQGIYTAGASCNDEDIIKLRENLRPIFSNNGVDIVLQSGENVYSESFFIDQDGEKSGTNYVSGNAIANNNGTVLYVGMGTIGDDISEFVSNDDLHMFTGTTFQVPIIDNPTFGKLSFNGETISYQGYQYDLAKDEIKGIVYIFPWWLILMISLVALLVVIITTAVVLITLHKKGKINIKVLTKIEENVAAKKAAKEALELGDIESDDVDADEKTDVDADASDAQVEEEKEENLIADIDTDDKTGIDMNDKTDIDMHEKTDVTKDENSEENKSIK